MKSEPKKTIILTMVFLIFLITLAITVKTYKDYTVYISASQEVIISNIAFALFLDFTVLIIGGLFLYLANQFYLPDKLAQAKVEEAKKQAEEKIKETDEMIDRIKKRRESGMY